MKLSQIYRITGNIMLATSLGAVLAWAAQLHAGPPDSTLRSYKRTDWQAKAKARDPRAIHNSPKEGKSGLESWRTDAWSVPRLRERIENQEHGSRSTLETHPAPTPETRYEYYREQYARRVHRYKKIQKMMKRAGHDHMVDFFDDAIAREKEYFERTIRKLGFEPEE